MRIWVFVPLLGTCVHLSCRGVCGHECMCPRVHAYIPALLPEVVAPSCPRLNRVTKQHERAAAPALHGPGKKCQAPQSLSDDTDPSLLPMYITRPPFIKYPSANLISLYTM